MKTISLKIGDRKSGRDPVKVPLLIPENLSDMTELARNNTDVVVRCFTRGWRIENQERSGAREAFGEGKTEHEIAKVVADYDPTEVRARGSSGPRKPKTITLPKGKKTFSAADLKALLEAQGVVVASEDEALAEA